jgi:hypothetical protein
MPPQYVKPYVKTNKHDAADAEVILWAVRWGRAPGRGVRAIGPRCGPRVIRPGWPAS